MSATTPRQDAQAYETVRKATALTRDVSARLTRTLAYAQDADARVEELKTAAHDAFGRSVDAYLFHLDSLNLNKAQMAQALHRNLGIKTSEAHMAVTVWSAARKGRDVNGGPDGWETLIRTQRDIAARLEALDPVAFGEAAKVGGEAHPQLEKLGVRQPVLDAFSLLRAKISRLGEASFLGVATRGEAEAFRRAAGAVADLRGKLLDLLMAAPECAKATSRDATRYGETRQIWEKGESLGAAFDPAAVLATADPSGPDPWKDCLRALEHRWIAAGPDLRSVDASPSRAAREASMGLALAALKALAAPEDDLSDTVTVPFDAGAELRAAHERSMARYARQTRLDDVADVREMPAEHEG